MGVNQDPAAGQDAPLSSPPPHLATFSHSLYLRDTLGGQGYPPSVRNWNQWGGGDDNRQRTTSVNIVCEGPACLDYLPALRPTVLFWRQVAVDPSHLFTAQFQGSRYKRRPWNLFAAPFYQY